ncbi:MAG: DEAD/DEAH box helicase, partial [Nanoarchaeota archaeon]|nr:DEAD/DEAH box helicase [Nanoarchaeota archaeon]
MKPEQASNRLLGITRSKAKMYEYNVPAQYHIDIPRDPSRLFPLAIGLLGDFASRLNYNTIDKSVLTEMRDNLHFSAYFFDAYCESKLKRDLDPYLLLLSSASYYLCDLPGSSGVLSSRLEGNDHNLDCLGLEKMLSWLLKGDFSRQLDNPNGVYGKYINDLANCLVGFFGDGAGRREVFKKSEQLINYVYANGSPRQLLFADLICALVKKRLTNSTWYCLPLYSGISIESWRPILKKGTFIKEFWPAQHLLGERGVFSGTSAIVQMPTSAGKTRAIEIIIRSSFLSGRTTLTVIVAPFKALCHEIKSSLVEAFYDEAVSVDELSDVLQTDFEVDTLLRRNQI